MMPPPSASVEILPAARSTGPATDYGDLSSLEAASRAETISAAWHHPGIEHPIAVAEPATIEFDPRELP